MNKYFKASFILWLIIFNSCKSGQPLTILNYQDPLKASEFYKGKGKIEISDGTNAQRAIANIRIHKDSMIWISISNKVEAARVIITPDSIKFLNRLEKKFFSSSIDSMASLFTFSFDFELIQNLLTSRTPTHEKVQWKQVGKEIVGAEKRGNWVLEYLLDSESKALKSLSVQEIQGPNTLKIAYSGFLDFEGGVIASEIISDAHYSRKNNAGIFHITLSYEKFSGAEKEEMNFSFKIPEKYEKL